jgi:hypothetical protein
MNLHRRRNKQALIAKITDLAFAVPQVVAHRVTRMVMAGPSLSERDRKEFQLMGAEKSAAIAESWIAIGIQVMRSNQTLAISIVRSFWSPLFGGRPLSAGVVATEWQNEALRVLGKGIGPVHHRAVGNAKRLARTKLR